MAEPPVVTLLRDLGSNCPNIVSAIHLSGETRRSIAAVLSRELAQWVSLDTSLVVFGSLARDEFTQGSDVDWTYLIDGQANAAHLTIARSIQDALERNGFQGPNQQGAFGTMVFSHSLIHQIGGQDDTNRNMTQRMLLLLESAAIGEKAQEAYKRVLKGVISRYLEEGSGPLGRDGVRYKVPRFLLNDCARFWRTMAVDFASKQRDRDGKGWGLRNFKLRMSRKLLFASGLLTCFGCHLDLLPEQRSGLTTDELRAYLIEYLQAIFRMTPLDVLAYSIRRYDVPYDIARSLFESYDRFLGMLSNQEIRKRLAALRAENASRDADFAEVREVSRQFQNSLDAIFLENSLVGPLTRKYGVF